jgi:transposase
MARLRREHVIVAQEMVAREVPVRQIARDLGVDESTVRYHVARGVDAPDGRGDRPSIMDDWQERVTAVLQRFADPRTGGDAAAPVEASVVHGVLRREFGFTGSYQAVRRYLTRTYPAAPVQAVRRVETPPGVQAQHDWFDALIRQSIRLVTTLRPAKPSGGRSLRARIAPETFARITAFFLVRTKATLGAAPEPIRVADWGARTTNSTPSRRDLNPATTSKSG